MPTVIYFDWKKRLGARKIKPNQPLKKFVSRAPGLKARLALMAAGIPQEESLTSLLKNPLCR